MARERRRPMSSESAIGRAVTRKARPAVAPDTPQAKARQIEGELGAAEAARRVGVSERTWRRWKAGGKPSGRNATALNTEADRAARRKAVAPRRETRLRRRGARARMSGNLGLPEARYRRHRTVEADLSPEQMGDIIDAWQAGDDDAALAALQDAFGENYLANFTFEDLTRLEFLRRDDE